MPAMLNLGPCLNDKPRTKPYMATMYKRNRRIQYIVYGLNSPQTQLLRRNRVRQKLITPRLVAKQLSFHTKSPYDSPQQLLNRQPFVTNSKLPNAIFEGMWRRLVVRLIQDHHMDKAEAEYNKLHLYLTGGVSSKNCHDNCTFAQFRETETLNANCFTSRHRQRLTNRERPDEHTWVTVHATPEEIKATELRLARAEALDKRLRKTIYTPFSFTLDEKSALLDNLAISPCGIQYVVYHVDMIMNTELVTSSFLTHVTRQFVQEEEPELASVWVSHLRDRYGQGNMEEKKRQRLTDQLEQLERDIYAVRCRMADRDRYGSFLA